MITKRVTEYNRINNALYAAAGDMLSQAFQDVQVTNEHERALKVLELAKQLVEVTSKK